MVTVRFFAVLKKLLERDSMHLELSGPITLKALLDRIESEIPAIRTVIREGRTMIAVNQEIAQDETLVSDGDEVAFLPPFAGGSH